MVSPVHIHPDAVYDDGAVAITLGIPTASLIRARREGSLRYTRQGRRAIYLGRWLLAWLESAAMPQEARHAS